jgi:hypothetical protein
MIAEYTSFAICPPCKSLSRLLCGEAEMVIDEGLRELSVPPTDFETIRLQLCATCATIAQRLSL